MLSQRSYCISTTFFDHVTKSNTKHFVHFFGFRLIQFSSAQAVMLSRSSCIVDGEPRGTTSEIVMSSKYFQ